MNSERLYDDNEEYDEFLFQSIQRYNTLQMFSLENIPQHVFQLDDFSICVASQRRKGQNSELLKLKLPTKLILPPEEEGRNKENDFRVLSGLYTQNLLHQIDKVESSNKIITSENDICGLQVYSFKDCSLGTNNCQDQKLNVTSWTSPNFAVIQETTNAVCSKSSNEPLIQADIFIGKQVKEIKHPFYNCDILPEISFKKINSFRYRNIKCKPLCPNVIAILNTFTGSIALHDLRTNNAFTFLFKSSKKICEEIWSLSGCDFSESSLNYFGVISNRDSFYIYEKRKNSIIFQNMGTSVPKENTENMKLKFNNKSDKFSTSGANSFVEVFELNNDSFQHVFTHNGHCPSNLPSAIVTDHMWVQTKSNEYVISICGNGSLNCWNYKV